MTTKLVGPSTDSVPEFRYDAALKVTKFLGSLRFIRKRSRKMASIDALVSEHLVRHGAVVGRKYEVILKGSNVPALHISVEL